MKRIYPLIDLYSPIEFWMAIALYELRLLETYMMVSNFDKYHHSYYIYWCSINCIENNWTIKNKKHMNKIYNKADLYKYNITMNLNFRSSIKLTD